MRHQHLFITGVTNSGTGMLRHLISYHKKSSVIMQEGHRFCKVLPHVKGRLFTQHPGVFRWTKDHLTTIDTKRIKRDFYNRFDLTKPLLVGKSPHHMYRLEFWSEVFKPTKFVGIVRSGFAVAEGLRRRTGSNIIECARHWNKANEVMMQDSSKVEFILVKYEDLVSNPQAVVDRIFSFVNVPSVIINPNEVMPRKNLLGQRFTLANSPDFNAESMKNLSDQDRKDIWNEAHSMMEFFGYENCI